MQKTVPQLLPGDRVRGEVVEILDASELIICFSGDLLRVSNASQRAMRVGEWVEVVVEPTAPLRFRLAPRVSHAPGRFDVKI